MEVINPYKLFNGIFIPDGVYNCIDISLLAKVVYGRLLRYAGKDGVAYPKQATIAEEMGKTTRQIQKVIRELREIGLIRITKGNPLNHETNKYEFLYSAILGLPDTKKSSPPMDTKKSSPPIKESHIKESHNNNNYLVIFKHYIEKENLIKHKNFTDSMKKSIELFIKKTKCSFEDCINVIDRHNSLVSNSTTSNFPVKARTFQELFGQKVYNGQELIGEQYLDGGKYYQLKQPETENEFTSPELIEWKDKN